MDKRTVPIVELWEFHRLMEVFWPHTHSLIALRTVSGRLRTHLRQTFGDDTRFLMHHGYDTTYNKLYH